MQQHEAERLAAAIAASRGLQLIGYLGAGAFKHTLHVRDTHGVDSALKVYQSASAINDARTAREIDAVSRCNHPAIVRFHGLWAWNDGGQQYAYSLEEFISGDSLDARLRSGLLPNSEVRALGATLVDVLAHLAERDLVHRDLKPANVMFRATGEPVVVDFGLVRDLAQDSLTQTWLPSGPCSPFFAAPEQLNNEKELIDWRTDQFSMAVLLWIAATGHHPYATSQDAHETVTRVGSRKPISPGFIAWASSQNLSVLPRMLAPWPVGRYRTPLELQGAWAAQVPA